MCINIDIFVLSSPVFSSKMVVASAGAAVFTLNAWFVRWSFTGMEQALQFCLLCIFFCYITGQVLIDVFYAGIILPYKAVKDLFSCGYVCSSGL